MRLRRNNSWAPHAWPATQKHGFFASLRSRSRGFTLLELMIVISIMMILMAVAVPLYQQHVIQAREAVLRQNLFQLDSLIEQYRLDKGQSPQSLDDLVTAGYLPKLPVDPMTGKADWTTDPEDPNNAVDPQQTGIARAHSSSAGTALNGEAYSTW
jgi:general secretion pathway protein G